MTLKYGWVSIYRSLQEHWIWQDEDAFDKRAAWIDLLLMANYEDKKVCYGSMIETLHPGQLHTSIDHLALRWRWSAKRVMRFLEMLEQDRMIYTKRNNKGTTLTIANYAKYQEWGNADDNAKYNADDNDRVNDRVNDNDRQCNNTNKANKDNKITNTAGDFSNDKPPKIGDIRFSQYDQHGNEWWERCVKIDPDGYVHWKGCWKWELKEFQEGKL